MLDFLETWFIVVNILHKILVSELLLLIQCQIKFIVFVFAMYIAKLYLNHYLETQILALD